MEDENKNRKINHNHVSMSQTILGERRREKSYFQNWMENKKQ